ncbi:hypothetical protein [Novosphingobium sp. FKTRR1]|uniref:hypothetical protein n=1 Tax=Novosphingobium sp. FKTRR1 TaxID=2879118 RepID=UPI001CEFC190|nr:hypothetical protein [Novosphingobium sp. FKTRR1]
MKRFTIEVSDRTAEALAQLSRHCSQSYEGANTHGPLSIEGLLAMLAEDAALVIERPGSWEGANMAQVFTSHGYEV